MIDVFAGALVAGASLGWAACDLTRRWRTRRPEPASSGIDLPSIPETPVVFSADGRPLQPETLAAVQGLLHLRAHVWMAQAYAAVVDQVAADEAASGVDAIEDAANERSV